MPLSGHSVAERSRTAEAAQAGEWMPWWIEKVRKCSAAECDSVDAVLDAPLDGPALLAPGLGREDARFLTTRSG